MKERYLVLGMAAILIASFLILLMPAERENPLTGMASASERNIAETGDVRTTYSVIHITRIETGYRFSEYEELSESAKELVDDCRGSSDIASCIASDMESGWTMVGSDGTVCLFEVTGSQNQRVYDEAEKKIIEKPLLYKFALDFS